MLSARRYPENPARAAGVRLAAVVAEEVRLAAAALVEVDRGLVGRWMAVGHVTVCLVIENRHGIPSEYWGVDKHW